MPRMVYVKAKPVTVERVLSPPMAFVEVAGRRIDQPICQAADDGTGIPVWAAVVDDETLTVIKDEEDFLGAGLNEVLAKAPAIHALITVQEILDPMEPGKKAVVGMGEDLPKGAEVISTRPAHTFSGWDPETGNPV